MFDPKRMSFFSKWLGAKWFGLVTKIEGESPNRMITFKKFVIHNKACIINIVTKETNNSMMAQTDKVYLKELHQSGQVELLPVDMKQYREGQMMFRALLSQISGPRLSDLVVVGAAACSAGHCYALHISV